MYLSGQFGKEKEAKPVSQGKGEDQERAIRDDEGAKVTGFRTPSFVVSRIRS